jgi:WD40 repeat protein
MRLWNGKFDMLNLFIFFALLFANDPIAWTASWSHNDAYVAFGNDKGELAIFETTNWKKVKSWNFGATTITRVEWNPKYPILAVAAVWHDKAGPVIQLYDIAKDQIIATLPDSLRGRAVSWSPSGEEVAFAGSKGRISIFGKDGKHRKTLSFTNPGSLFEIDWHPVKNLLLAVEEDIYVIDIDRDSLLATYDDGTKNKGILCCQWHPSGEFFVTGDYGHVNENIPCYLSFWNKKGSLVTRSLAGKAEYRNARWSRDGKYLAAASDGLIVFNEKGLVLSKAVFNNNNVWGVAWNSKGDKIVSSDQVGNIRVTDLKGKVLKSFR